MAFIPQIVGCMFIHTYISISTRDNSLWARIEEEEGPFRSRRSSPQK